MELWSAYTRKLVFLARKQSKVRLGEGTWLRKRGLVGKFEKHFYITIKVWKRWVGLGGGICAVEEGDRAFKYCRRCVTGSFVRRSTYDDFDHSVCGKNLEPGKASVMEWYDSGILSS